MMDSYCEQCHADVHRGWASSMHRFSSFNNPAYSFSVASTRRNLLEREGNATAVRFCAGCHELIDPVGFGLEAYDAVGAFRAEENGQPIDTTGELLGLEDLYDEQAWSFEGLPGLADILAASTSARRCYVTQSWRFATGRLEEPEDACTLGALDASFEAADGDLRELLVQWAASPEVALRRTP